jgi:predicted metal-dependent HD superfamily phosphohydrolase
MEWHLRWRHLWRMLTPRTPTDDLLPELLAHYRAPDRAYHTLQHLAECLDHFDSARPFVKEPIDVELALWLHDVIYDTHRSDNEEASAQWAQSHLLAAGVVPATVNRVIELIQLTKHVDEPSDEDGALLLDIDLAILGADPERFAEYEGQVRQEYQWVPWPAFCMGRSQILRAFLQRPSIYRTDFFRARLEAQARINLAASLDRLTLP